MGGESELFAFLDDLEGEAQELWQADREAEIADRAHIEYAGVTLASRFMASLGGEVDVDVRGVGRISGRLERVGADWCLVATGTQEWLVSLAHVTSVRGLSSRALPEVAWSPLHRLALRSALRRVAEVGDQCRVHLVDSTRHEGAVLRVGGDFLEMTVPATGSLVVPLSAIAAVVREG